jgi:sortase (surface protein transpeptidase)
VARQGSHDAVVCGILSALPTGQTEPQQPKPHPPKAPMPNPRHRGNPATVTRRLAILIALFLALVIASPAAALTLKREWRAQIGAGGAYGTAKIDAWTSGTGTWHADISSAKVKASYHVVIYTGSCSNPGSAVVSLGSVTSSTAGTITTTRSITAYRMGKLWAARGKTLIIRMVSGSSIRCGTLAFTHATRVQIPHYNIDLPVVKGPNHYPWCNVAMYLPALMQPTEPGVTYLYAHARKGMFLPLLNASKVNDGAAMIGRLVYVWTTANERHTYKITRVRRHVTSIQSALSVTSERLWLQTSEGPNYTYPKLIVVAERVATTKSTYTAAHPKPHPIRC